MTPKLVATRRRPATSFEEYRQDGEATSIESRAFWNYALAPALPGEDVRELLPIDEQRVLSKASSGGGYLVPTEVGEMVINAARAASAVARLAQEFVTAAGETLNVAIGDAAGSATWTAESGSYTPSDPTITQVALGAYKSTTKIIVSEELRTDEAVSLDAYLAAEMGARLGALQETAFVSGDGSGNRRGYSTRPARSRS